MILRPYPLHCLQGIGSDFARCITDTLQTKEALVGPIVLSAMSAAVHGSLDINTPMHRLMPASLYTTVVAGSGLGKTATTNYAYHGFREFEAKCVGSISPKDGFVASKGHPYRIDDASEAGLVPLFGECVAPECIDTCFVDSGPSGATAGWTVACPRHPGQ